VVNNNYPQITSVTSEALQAQIRNLLPSQEGFGTDLMAQNVIVPIIDLTAAAEGTTVPANLAEAISFGNVTAFSASASTVVLANTSGFWRITGTVSNNGANANNTSGSFTMTDGVTVKTLQSYQKIVSVSQPYNFAISFDFTVFLTSGDSVSAAASDAYTQIQGHYYQIADVNGNRVLPSGFSPQ
jgi:hypothetical protein